MGCYPIFLEMAGRSCVVIGGGAVAERKVAALPEGGAAVTIVSPSLSAPLETLAKAGKVRHVGRDYAPGDLAGHQFAFIGAGGGEVNGAGGPGGGAGGGGRPPAPAPDGAAWRKALDADFRRLVADGKREKAKAYLLERLGAGR